MNALRMSLVMLAPLLPANTSAQVDTSEWLCETCPFDDGYRATIDIGGTGVSDDAARFGNATGYDKKGVYANVGGDGVYANDAYRLAWRAEDLGLSSRVLEMRGGKRGLFDIDISYRELPYRRFDTTSTVFLPSTRGALLLPSGWIRAGTTAGMPTLQSSLRRQNVESDRQILDLGARWRPFDRISLYADFQRQNRDGIKITSGSGFTQASLLPRFFDHETDHIDAGVRYAFDRGHVGVAWYGSFFTHRHNSITWETPFLTAPGAENLRAATAPDNDFQQVSLSGALSAAAWDTVVAFSLATGRGEQNEMFLPYTINPNAGAAALPRVASDARVDTANYSLTITSRPLENGRIRFTYRRDERDNQTPIDDWQRIIVDVFNSGETEQNVPYGFDRSRLDISGELVVWKGIRVSGGYEYKQLKRDNQEVAEQTTDAGWGQIRWRPFGWLDLRAKGGTTERDIDRYDESVAISLGQNPLLRKYNLAYRFRSWGEFVATFALPDARWSFTATARLADDRYNRSRLGMTDSEELHVTADFSIAIGENASVFILLGREEIDALQTGSEQFASWDWLARHDDDFTHIGVGGRWRDSDEKLDLRIDFNRGEGKTSIRLDSLSGGPSVLPVLESTLDSLRIAGNYRLSERFTGTLNLRYERFELSDWALVASDTLPTILTLGAQPYDYDAWALGLGIRYSVK